MDQKPEAQAWSSTIRLASTGRAVMSYCFSSCRNSDARLPKKVRCQGCKVVATLKGTAAAGDRFSRPSLVDDRRDKPLRAWASSASKRWICRGSTGDCPLASSKAASRNSTRPFCSASGFMATLSSLVGRSLPPRIWRREGTISTFGRPDSRGRLGRHCLKKILP